MKLCNFLRFDPAYQGVGLSRGGKAEESIWVEFSNDRGRLRAIAGAICACAGAAAMHESAEDYELQAPEGRVLYRMHRTHERSRGLVNRKKQLALRECGRLACEICGIDFAERYGAMGQGFIECHHRVPLAMLEPHTSTKLTDLVLVCPNCHSMLHANSGHSVEEVSSSLH